MPKQNELHQESEFFIINAAGVTNFTVTLIALALLDHSWSILHWSEIASIL